jgi:hypothetical protein
VALESRSQISAFALQQTFMSMFVSLCIARLALIPADPFPDHLA